MCIFKEKQTKLVKFSSSGLPQPLQQYLAIAVLKYICLQVEKWVDPKSGQSTGRIQHPDSLLRAVQSLIDRSMVNAVAVVARFPDDDVEDTDDYRQGMVR